jgi:hypothetical protein
MTKTKVLSVVANQNERSDSPNGFGLVAAVERAVSSFVEENGATEVSYTLSGTVIDAGAGSVNAPDAVFGRTLVVLTYEPGTKPKETKKKK